MQSTTLIPRPQEFAVGDVLDGRYRVVDMLGEGTTSVVYLAEHLMIRRQVAVKIMVPELCDDHVAVERFMNEARAAGTLGHPHIITSTDMGYLQDGRRPYIVFEHLPGRLLTLEIYRSGPMPTSRVATIAYQIASALGAAHGADIVHRDIKSDNIYMVDCEDGADFVKVLDFGISKFLAHDRRTRNGMLMGTPEFMAPEQISTPDAIDLRADIYALGVMMYEMTEARRPFSGVEDSYRLLHKIVAEPVAPMLRTDLPDGYADLIYRMLAKSPADRPQTMAEVQRALGAFGVEPAGVRPVTGPIGKIATPPERPVPQPPAPRARIWPYLALGLALSGVAVAFLWLRRGAEAPVAVSARPAIATAPVVTPAAAPSDAADDKVLFWVASDHPGARVTFRGRRSEIPHTERVTPASDVEAVDVTAPGCKTVRYWLKVDRATRLQPVCSPGTGNIEASELATKAALGEIDPATGMVYQADETARARP